VQVGDPERQARPVGPVGHARDVTDTAAHGTGGTAADWTADRRVVRRVERRAGAELDPGRWPYSLPPVAQLLRDGLDLPPGVTFLVGENGSGKSTLVEAVAAAAGLNAEGGSRYARHTTRVSESPLSEVLQLVRSVGAPRWAYFLRAETMHGLYTYLEELPPGPRSPPPLHEMSHGESFLEVLAHSFAEPGLYLLDEPEAALSFRSCLTLVRVLHDLAEAGSQVLCATHSPLITALPGAQLLQLDDDGITPVTWQDLELVDHWRRYLESPQAYLRHVLE
jgi:predicted ATPase